MKRTNTSPSDQDDEAPENKVRAVEPLHTSSVPPSPRRNDLTLKPQLRRRSLLNTMIHKQEGISDELLKKEVEQEFSHFQDKVGFTLPGEEQHKLAAKQYVSALRDKFEDMELYRMNFQLHSKDKRASL
jgi:hypothetical protein